MGGVAEPDDVPSTPVILEICMKNCQGKKNSGKASVVYLASGACAKIAGGSLNAGK
jgi:hypothetical protein